MRRVLSAGMGAGAPASGEAAARSRPGHPAPRASAIVPRRESCMNSRRPTAPDGAPTAGAAAGEFWRLGEGINPAQRGPGAGEFAMK